MRIKIFSKERIKTLAIIVLLVVLVTVSFDYLKVRNENQATFHSFLEEYYSQMQVTSSSIAFVLSNKENPEELGDGLNEFHNRVHELDSLLETGYAFVDRDLTLYSFSPVASHKEWRSLTDDQVAELKRIKEALDFIVGELNDDVGMKRVNVEEFDEIFIDGIQYGNNNF